MKKILPFVFLVIVLAVGALVYNRNLEKEDLTVVTERDTAAPDIKHYASTKYGFDIAYPSSAKLVESVFNDNTNVDSWSIVEERPGKPEPQPVDCGVTYEDELYMSIGIADLQASAPNLKSHAEAVAKRYDDAGHMTVEQGGKRLKVEEKIPGMCREATEVLWKDESERYIVIFSYPSETKREQDYWDIIQSFNFR